MIEYKWALAQSIIVQRTRERDAARDLAAKLEAQLAVLEKLVQPASRYDKSGNYEGRVGGTEHRTVGLRAWCFECAEWCHETYSCPCCES